MSDDVDLDDPSSTVPAGSSGAAAVVLPFLTAIAALTLGAVLGGAIGWVAKPAERVEVKVPRELTAEEVTAACAPEVESKVSALSEAQNKISFLEKEVADRDARVKELEAGTKRGSGGGGSSLAAQLEQAKRDLAEARAQLEQARADKETLIAELTQTKEILVQTEQALTVQVQQTQRAKEDALVNKWYRFVNDAQLEICEKGSRKKLGECREIVSAALQTNLRRDKFAHCVRSGQAVPLVKEIDKNEKLPSFSEMVGDDKDLKDWAVLFCDPTLPERTDGFLNETPLPRTASRE